MKLPSSWAAAYVTPLFVLLVTITVLMIGASDAWAYEAYSEGDDSGFCADCHGDFRANPYSPPSGEADWTDDLHDVHRNDMLGGDCSTCHAASGGFFPVSLESSGGGDGLEPISCVGCHGRDDDMGQTTATGTAQRGAGLRQHHAGVASCGGCHDDQTGYTPVGENVLPNYYANPGNDHPAMPEDSCNPNGSEGVFAGSLLGLDNDGNGIYDTADDACSENTPPVADANGPYSGTVGSPVSFDGSGSTDPDGTIPAYQWDFGDGDTGAGVSPSHSYAAAGTYTVSLTVTDNDGASSAPATTTATIEPVANEPPVADPNGPYSGTTGSPVLFDGTGSSDPDGTIVAYDWDFGDGNTGTGDTPSHSYAADGTYTVSLTVTDNDGASDTATTTAAISAPDVLDLDLVSLKPTKKVRLARVKPVVLKLVVKNVGTVEGSADVTITGMQNGVEVYNETLTVTDPLGNGRTTYDDGSVPAILPYVPTVAGDILWKAIIVDGDPDIDEITAVTTVTP